VRRSLSFALAFTLGLGALAATGYMTWKFVDWVRTGRAVAENREVIFRSPASFVAGLKAIAPGKPGRWLVGRGQVPEAALKDVPTEFTPAELERWTITSDTPAGRLHHLGPVMRLSETPPRWARPSVPLGYHEPVWPARAT